MEPEGSLSCPQQPVIGPYPKADESSLQHSALFKIRFNIIFPSTSRSYKSLPLGLPTKSPHVLGFSPMRAICTARLILLGMIIFIVFGDECKLWSCSSLCNLLQLLFFSIRETRWRIEIEEHDVTTASVLTEAALLAGWATGSGRWCS